MFLSLGATAHEAGEDYIAVTYVLCISQGSPFLPESDSTVLLLLSCCAVANGGFGVTYMQAVLQTT